jgi:uncharacterized membrane protein
MDHESNTAALNSSDSLSWREPDRLVLYGIIAAILIVAPHVMPEFLRAYGAYRMLYYGLILIVIMALSPQGIMGDIGF